MEWILLSSPFYPCGTGFREVKWWSWDSYLGLLAPNFIFTSMPCPILSELGEENNSIKGVEVV